MSPPSCPRSERLVVPRTPTPPRPSPFCSSSSYLTSSPSSQRLSPSLPRHLPTSSPDASQLPIGTLRLVVKSLDHLAFHLDPTVEEDGLDGGGGGGGDEVAVLRGGYSSCVSPMVCTLEFFSRGLMTSRPSISFA
jgi:hypothetical protein